MGERGKQKEQCLPNLLALEDFLCYRREMPKAVLNSVEAVKEWVANAGKACEWRVNTGPGRVSESKWMPYATATSLPMEKPLTIRIKGSKTEGAAVYITNVAITDGNLCPTCNRDQSEWKERLRVREIEIDQDEYNIRVRERAFSTQVAKYESDKCNNIERSIRLQMDVDRDRESREKDIDQFRDQIDGLIQRAQKAENYRDIGAHAKLTVDRAMGILAMRNIRKMEDVSPEFLEKFNRFMQHEALVEHFNLLPHAGRRVADDVARLPKDQIVQFFQVVIQWGQENGYIRMGG